MKRILSIVSIVSISLLFGLFSTNLSATKVEQASQKIYDKVDKLPVFNKKRGNIQKYLSTQIKYPVDALATETEGKVIVSVIINEKGQLSDVKVEKGLSESLDKEALRVVNTMQDWKAGEVDGNKVSTKMSIPVQFYLNDENKKLAQQIKPFYANGKTPLFVLDNKKVLGLKTIEYYNVKSIRVMKGKKAVELFGEDAKNGVVIVESKRGTPRTYQRY